MGLTGELPNISETRRALRMKGIREQTEVPIWGILLYIQKLEIISVVVATLR